MAYDEGLAERVRDVLAHLEVAALERAMFGGLAFMVRGHMTVGVLGEDLMVRVGPDAYENALARPDARPMDFTGKPMTCIVYVAAVDQNDEALTAWVQRGLAFTGSLPAK